MNNEVNRGIKKPHAVVMVTVCVRGGRNHLVIWSRPARFATSCAGKGYAAGVDCESAGMDSISRAKVLESSKRNLLA